MGRDEVLQPDRGPLLDEFRPGHVFWLPPGSTWMNEDKPRPFALATQCSPGVRGTLVYGSTRTTEKRAGAACIEVPPRPHGLNRNGLRANTFFYPGALFRTAYGELPAHAGFLGRYRGELREALRIALGIGQGSCASSGAPAGSRRGRIVELEPDLARDLRTRFAVLLTEQQYSREDNYHVILPLYPNQGQSVEPPVLTISGGDWLAVFPEQARSALLPVQVTQSVWYPDDIAGETEHVMDDDSLARIDQALCDYFALPGPPAG